MDNILDYDLLTEKSELLPISATGYDGKYWSGNSVKSLELAFEEVKKYMQQGDIAWKIIDPNTKTIYTSLDEADKEAKKYLEHYSDYSLKYNLCLNKNIKL